MAAKKMPVLFVGHGSPMNAIENNSFTKSWEALGHELPKPQAILSVSAHWYTEGTFVNDSEHPRMVYDMYGFPPALYQVQYPAPGAPETARKVASLLQPGASVDNSWGLDHGSWSVLCRMFPGADIPVFQLSVNGLAGAQKHFELGQRLAVLREQGVLIFGSGNVVHNLRRVDWDNAGGYPWAEEFDGYIREKIQARAFGDVVDYRAAGASATLSVPTPDHFYPLLYALGASDAADNVTVLNDACTMGSLSMTSYLFG